MRARLKSAWFGARYSFWFYPTVMVIGAIALALVSDRVDRAVDNDGGVAWIYSGSAEGARAMLSAIAGSMITVAGLVFSITITTLTLASQQFGPRLLRNFIRDRGNQIVLGTFIATFVYCLLVLRQVRGGENEFIPGFSITIALLLALLSLGVLIYFIHHVASSIQANSIVASVGRDLEEAIDRLFPQDLGRSHPGETEDDHLLAARVADEGEPILATRSGYVEAVDNESLMTLARDCDAVISLHRRPGHYVTAGAEAARVLASGEVDDAFRGRLNGALLLAASRSVEQDVEFAVEQLVEVAVRALSTGINDPFTAMVCIDRLTSSMVRLMGRELPSPYRHDSDGRLRVITPAVTFEGVMDAAFNPIRQYGGTSVPVVIHLVEAMGTLYSRARTDEQRRAIIRHGMLVASTGREQVTATSDREDLEARIARLESLAATRTPTRAPRRVG
jgi:uncharacterized membrane protein